MNSDQLSIQNEDFSIAEEYRQLRAQAGDAGAVVTFTGLVREMYQAEDQGSKIDSLFLEHYRGMTEKCLLEIIQQAETQWPLLAVRVIHRIGELKPGEQIVMVATASAHRHAAFDAAQYIMDFLKSKAPFWKRQSSGEDSHWVESRESDAEAIERWQ